MRQEPAIWVIEDGPGQVQILREAMRLCGVRGDITVADNGAAAMQSIQQYRDGTLGPLPDLVLLDLDLPHVPGQEILRTLKSDPQFQAIPVIVLSGSSSRQEIDAVYRSHANAFVPKPDRLDEFVTLVSTVGAFWLKIAALPTRPENGAKAIEKERARWT